MSEEIDRKLLERLIRTPIHIRLKYDGPQPKKKKPFTKSVVKVSKQTQSRPAFFEVAVEEELDLHGRTIDQGIAETELFIDMALRYGLKTVRVIHGQGPLQGPSLRSEVRKFLKTRCNHKIEGFVIEPHNDGAVVVTLKSKGSRSRKS